ncbi:MAG: hypothetical protein DRJ10_00590 [Bacteroidetes bacterium]|nr:MAG: hypothetical protein DRJ10_00590 [Bacteroidota bacterium]
MFWHKTHIEQIFVWKAKFLTQLFLFLITTSLIGQSNENATSIIGENRYIEFKFQNDFFFKTDYYYSNGLVFNFIFPDFSKSPVSKILIPVKKESLDYYGISIVQELYTPIHTGTQGVVFNDRPYSSILYLGHKRTSFIPATRTKISNELIIGIIGRYSFGYDTQAYFHEAINNSIPAGWNNQVANDLIINYHFAYEEEFYSNNFFELMGKANIRVGTLYDDVSAGFKMRLGYFNPSNTGFGQVKIDRKESNGLKKFQIYAYINPSIRAVFYNGTLQGGLFNQSSPFTLNYKWVEPIVSQLNSGFVFQYSLFQLQIESTMLTPEFIGGNYHKWLSVGLRFNF